MNHQLARWMVHTGSDKANFLSILSFHQSHGFSKITIVGDNDSAIIRIQPVIIQKLHGQIDIRAFFLGLYDLGHTRPACHRLGKSSRYRMTQEMSKIHFEFRAVMFKRSQVNILAFWLRRVARPCRYPCCEILYFANVVRRLQDGVEKAGEIKPLVRCALQGAII